MAATIAGTIASAYARHQFNTHFPSSSSSFTPAFRNTGEISYSRDGDEAHITIVDVNLNRVERDMEMVTRALDKLATTWEPVSLNTFEISEDVQPMMAVLQTLGEDLEEIEQEQAMRQGR